MSLQLDEPLMSAQSHTEDQSVNEPPVRERPPVHELEEHDFVARVAFGCMMIAKTILRSIDYATSSSDHCGFQRLRWSFFLVDCVAAGVVCWRGVAVKWKDLARLCCQPALVSTLLGLWWGMFVVDLTYENGVTNAHDHPAKPKNWQNVAFAVLNDIILLVVPAMLNFSYYKFTTRAITQRLLPVHKYPWLEYACKMFLSPYLMWMVSVSLLDAVLIVVKARDYENLDHCGAGESHAAFYLSSGVSVFYHCSIVLILISKLRCPLTDFLSSSCVGFPLNREFESTKSHESPLPSFFAALCVLPLATELFLFAYVEHGHMCAFPHKYHNLQWLVFVAHGTVLIFLATASFARKSHCCRTDVANDADEQLDWQNNIITSLDRMVKHLSRYRTILSVWATVVTLDAWFSVYNIHGLDRALDVLYYVLDDIVIFAIALLFNFTNHELLRDGWTYWVCFVFLIAGIPGINLVWYMISLLQFYSGPCDDEGGIGATLFYTNVAANISLMGSLTYAQLSKALNPTVDHWAAGQARHLETECEEGDTIFPNARPDRAETTTGEQPTTRLDVVHHVEPRSDPELLFKNRSDNAEYWLVIGLVFAFLATPGIAILALAAS